MKTKIIILLTLLASLHLAGQLYSQTSPAVLKREALKHMDAGRFGEAIDLWTTLIRQTPENAEAYNMRGICYEKRTRWEKALSDFTRAARLKPDHPEYQKNIREVRKKLTGQLTERIEGYKRELAINPGIVRHYYSIAKSYESLGDTAEAQKWYDQYFAKTEGGQDEVLQYTELLARRNSLQKGLEISGKYVQHHPEDYQVQSRYGYFLMWLGKSGEAKAAFEKALKIQPSYSEAKDGLSQLSRPRKISSTSRKAGPASAADISKTGTGNLVQYLSAVKANPSDTQSRYKLVDELIKRKRLEEAFDQLQLVLKDSTRFLFYQLYPERITARRDSLCQALIRQYSDKVSANPKDRDAAMHLAGYYEIVGDQYSSLEVYKRYMQNIQPAEDADMRFRYAQRAAWSGDYKTAESNLMILLNQTPRNLEYQLLLGQVMVWSGKDLDKAVILLKNVNRSEPENTAAVVALSSLYTKQKDYVNAEKFLKIARSLAPQNKEVLAAAEFYEKALRAKKEKEIYRFLEEGRQLSAEGKCREAMEKYDAYLARVIKPDRAVMLEYADLYTCRKEPDKAIAIYDTLLSRKYDYDVALRRAKNYLWNGQTGLALSEFKKLSMEHPENFDSQLFIGDAYQQLKDYSKAKSIYKSLMQDTRDSRKVQMIQSRLNLLPATGFRGMFQNFPSPLAFSPVFNMYSDNLNFQLDNRGGKLEAGIARILSAGATYSRLSLSSLNSRQEFTAFKGQLSLNLNNHLLAAAGFGTLNSVGLTPRNTGDFSIEYKAGDVFSTRFSYENTDAALVLYSPYLVSYRYGVDYYRISGFFENKSHVRLSGYFSYISISDGNVGNSFQFRIGKGFYDQVYFGYESQFTTYKYLSSYVPHSNGTAQLYWAPQNMDQHSLWADWNIEQVQNLDVHIGSRLGYIPKYNVVLRELSGKVNYGVWQRFVIQGELTGGSSYRYDGSYNYFSAALSVYLRLY